ncbi:MAG: hypothetical protein IPO38_11320 [Rhodocyclaceae bacterium]|nr:hypothetical protein [Rhodocyclaceae bacterium]
MTSTASIGTTKTRGTTAATGATIASGTVLGAVAGDTLAFSNGSGTELQPRTSAPPPPLGHHPLTITSSTPGQLDQRLQLH